jgi:DNA-binding transcriptional MerR regulator
MSTNAGEKNENQVRIYDPDDLEWNAEHQVRRFKGTTLSEAQQFAVKLCKRIKLLGGELPMNWLDCELIYLERFAQKLQRRLDRKVIGF